MNGAARDSRIGRLLAEARQIAVDSDPAARVRQELDRREREARERVGRPYLALDVPGRLLEARQRAERADEAWRQAGRGADALERALETLERERPRGLLARLTGQARRAERRIEQARDRLEVARDAAAEAIRVHRRLEADCRRLEEAHAGRERQHRDAWERERDRALDGLVVVEAMRGMLERNPALARGGIEAVEQVVEKMRREAETARQKAERLLREVQEQAARDAQERAESRGPGGRGPR